MIQASRIRLLNDKPVGKGRFVLYWMQQSQRVEYNHALAYAVGRADEMAIPVLVYFGLTGDFPEANARHYRFMLEGLAEVRDGLERMGILFVVHQGNPVDGLMELAAEASIVVADRGYLRIQRAWRREAAERAKCAVVQVESDVVVPVEEASPKEEYSAGTFRPKITRKLGEYLVALAAKKPRRDSLGMRLPSAAIEPIHRVISELGVDVSVPPVDRMKGGASAARRLLGEFIRRRLDGYAELRNDPARDFTSHMSSYLHFGQISPLYIALKIGRHSSPGSGAYLEELIVRRELGINFVHYNHHYDSFECLPDWAKATLGAHRGDRRDYVYELEELESARTHDPYWNAAQREMLSRGAMHGYMRMYWGKKVLEWSESPEAAYATLLRLNNRYFIDGRDPNGYAGAAWCFGKHDRPWGRREIFGTVRYMNARGLERKFSMDSYVSRFSGLDHSAAF
jgi:deoxyribodipyrimidine photo-lyase